MPIINANFSEICQEFLTKSVSVMSVKKLKLSGLHKVHNCHLHLFLIFEVNVLF